jgi:hypothetical protein
MRWLGVGLFVAGGALRLWPVFVLGRRFSGLVAIQPGHTLVTRGVYGGHPPPELSGATRQRTGVGARFSCGGGRTAHGAHDPAYSRTHPCGRAAIACAVWQRVRRLLRPDSTAASRALLVMRVHAHESLPLGPRG